MNTQDGYDWPNGCTDERWPAEDADPVRGARWCVEVEERRTYWRHEGEARAYFQRKLAEYGLGPRPLSLWRLL